MGLEFPVQKAASRYAFKLLLVFLFILLSLQICVFTLPVYAEAPLKEETKALSDVEQVMPGDGAIKNGLPLTYTWQAQPDVDHYIYESYVDEALQVLHERQTVHTNTFERTEQHGSTLWWRVKAVFADGKVGEWNPVRRVIVDNEAPDINNVTEGDLSQVRGIAVLKFEVRDNYPDRIIAAMDGALMSSPSVIKEMATEDGIVAQSQVVTIRLTVNLDTLALSDGPHLLTIRAVDHAGNISEPLQVNFTVVNNPPKAQEPQNLPSGLVETIQPVNIQQVTPIAPILGGERIEAPGIVLADKSAVTQADVKTVKETLPVNAHDHPVGTPHINFGWPMWLGFGALLSGTGWWVFSGRKRF